MHLELVDVFLVLGEEAQSFLETGNLSCQRQVMDEVKGEVNMGGVVSADLELPQVIRCVLRSLSLVVIRGSIQRTSILIIVAWNHTNDMGIRSHDDSGKVCRNIPAMVVGNDAGHIIGPAVVIEAYGRRHLSSSWRASRQQFSSIANPCRNSWYLCSHTASLRPCTLLSLGSALLGRSRSMGHSMDLGTRGRGTGRDLCVAQYGRFWKGNISGC